MSRLPVPAVLMLVAASFLLSEPGHAAEQSDGFLDAAGVRYGISEHAEDTRFHEAEAFTTFRLPLRWEIDENWFIQAGAEGSLGWIENDYEQSFIASAGPLLTLGRKGFPLGLQTGWAPTFLAEDNFRTRDFGSHLQFQTHLGLNFDLGSRLRMSFRVQHLSNGGFAQPNPGINTFLFGLAYRF